jgi:hypothetical protein
MIDTKEVWNSAYDAAIADGANEGEAIEAANGAVEFAMRDPYDRAKDARKDRGL